MTRVRVVRSCTTSPRRKRGIASEPTGAAAGRLLDQVRRTADGGFGAVGHLPRQVRRTAGGGLRYAAVGHLPRQVRRTAGGGLRSAGGRTIRRERRPGTADCRDSAERPTVQRDRVRGCGSSHGLDPAQQRERRELEPVGDARTDHAAGDAGDEAPDRERTDHRRGQEVRRERDERDGAEHREQDGEHAELGRGRDPERVADPLRAGDAGADRGTEPEDPGRRAAGQQEADRVEEERVGDEQADRGKRVRMRLAGTGRPRNVAAIAMPAIAEARRTDGSQRVIVPKRTRISSPTTSRLPSRSRTSNGVATARTNATFAPLTAKRWLRPASRKLPTRSSGIARVSPSRNPASTARSVAGSPSAPRRTAARELFASRSRGDRGPSNAVSSVTCIRATACRHR